MRRIATPVLPALFSVLAAAVLGSLAFAQIPLTGYGAPVTEDFNTLASMGTSSAVPAGWAFVETGTNANTTYSAGNGTGTGGDTYSWGATASAERAFGGLLSSSLTPTFGASFVNNIGGPVGRLDIEYVGEQWRLGTLAREDRLNFQYSLDATALNNGSWIDVDVLDFVAPVTGPAIGALDGNAAGNRTAVFGSISGIALQPGATIWIRWADLNASGADDGLGVDDFRLTPREPPVPSQPSTLGGMKGVYR